jgi:hypothetical protein
LKLAIFFKKWKGTFLRGGLVPPDLCRAETHS